MQLSCRHGQLVAPAERFSHPREEGRTIKVLGVTKDMCEHVCVASPWTVICWEVEPRATHEDQLQGE